MPANEPTIQNVLDVISDLAQVMHDGFGRLEAKIDRADRRIDRVEVKLVDHDARFDEVIGHLTALEEDVKELYHMVAKLQRDHEHELAANRELRKKVEAMQAYLELVAEKTGIALPAALQKH